MRSIFFTLLAVTVLFSCSKDKDPAPASIVGKWEVTGLKTQLQIGDKSLKQSLIDSGMSEAEAEQTVQNAQTGIDVTGKFSGTLELKADGTWSGVVIGSDDSASGTWKLSDDKKTLTLTDSSASNDGDEGA